MHEEGRRRVEFDHNFIPLVFFLVLSYPQHVAPRMGRYFSELKYLLRTSEGGHIRRCIESNSMKRSW